MNGHLAYVNESLLVCNIWFYGENFHQRGRHEANSRPCGGSRLFGIADVGDVHLLQQRRNGTSTAGSHKQIVIQALSCTKLLTPSSATWLQRANEHRKRTEKLKSFNKRAHSFIKTLNDSTFTNTVWLNLLYHRSLYHRSSIRKPIQRINRSNG